MIIRCNLIKVLVTHIYTHSLSLSLYIYIYIERERDIHTYIIVCIYLSLSLSLYIHIYIYIYLSLSLSIYIYIYIYTHGPASKVQSAAVRCDVVLHLASRAMTRNTFTLFTNMTCNALLPEVAATVLLNNFVLKVPEYRF